MQSGQFPKPFAQSYWVIPGKLLAGAYPGSRDPVIHETNIRALTDANIQLIINLTEANEVDAEGLGLVRYQERFMQLSTQRGKKPEYHQFGIPDGKLPHNPEQMLAILNTIDNALAGNRPVYVHCRRGHGRTGMVIGCWLKRNHRFTDVEIFRSQNNIGQAALARIADLRTQQEMWHANHPSPETNEQKQFVIDWAEPVLRLQTQPSQIMTTTGKPIITFLDGRIELWEENIVTFSADAIVNAANPELEAGAGVCGAILKAGGNEIFVESKSIAALRGGKVPVGSAFITGGGQLPARHVIHAVGPRWQGGNENEAALLAAAYQNCLIICMEKKLRSIVFPTISTGIYGFPKHQAAQIAINTVKPFLQVNELPEKVIFTFFSRADLNYYSELLSNSL
jgi:O-acetyl-ADP-ribose deacetylase (regulator of RNase III)